MDGEGAVHVGIAVEGVGSEADGDEASGLAAVGADAGDEVPVRVESAVAAV